MLKSTEKTYEIVIAGGGLAGCEAAYQLLKRGYQVLMYEMRPKISTGAHQTGNLGELVCSNSLKSCDELTAHGILKKELEVLDCLLLRLAYNCRVEAGGALAVDRELFSKNIEIELFKFPNFKLVREEFTKFNDIPTIIATGPLTSKKLTEKLSQLAGVDNLFFFDAVAPIVIGNSVDMSVAFWGGRYGKGGEDYLNLPMEKDEYLSFYNELIAAKSVQLHDFENAAVFEGCMPIEVMAKRGQDVIRFGPLKPVGITNFGKKYYAVAQLRKENISGDAFNLVGFQTNLTFSEQKRVFSMLPGLKNAEFLRYGVMHRNTFLNSPKILDSTFRVKGKSPLYIAGQLSGVEGYVESIMSGLLASIHLDRELKQKETIIPSENTICGALSKWISTASENFQPMNSNLGLLPPFEIRDKTERKKAYSKRAIDSIKEYYNNLQNTEK